MTQEPKLLTEAEARNVHTLAAGMREIEGFLAELRERGLIAPEPVDLKRALIKAIIGAYHTTRVDADYVSHILNKPLVQAAFAGMELAPAASPLTRERLSAMFDKAWVRGLCDWEKSDRSRSRHAYVIDALHAALTEQVQP